MTETSVPLAHTFTTNFENNLVTVPANGEAQVTICDPHRSQDHPGSLFQRCICGRMGGSGSGPCRWQRN